MGFLERMRSLGIKIDHSNPAMAVLLEAEQRKNTEGFDGPAVVTEAEFKGNGGKLDGQEEGGSPKPSKQGQ
jgi:hypothetical protein